MLVAHQAGDVNLPERNFSDELEGQHDHTGNPEENDFETSYRDTGGMEWCSVNSASQRHCSCACIGRTSISRIRTATGSKSSAKSVVAESMGHLFEKSQP
ncbi:MAG: hypothetical protein OXE78_11760 [Gammaproteobacteria bacterium]|nr:hypothetical protein [Gammaproteobacteria bacterium]MCY4357109.1 hypothetical protein [Gammaproteobacteria bacterium]